MSQSTRFPAAVHILAILAVDPEQHINSEQIASSVGTNSVVVRRILSHLRRAGLVASQTGAGGGTRLNVDPGSVSLLDVYDAVEGTCLFRLHDPHPDCPVACSVKASLAETVERMMDVMRQDMATTSLAKVTDPAVKEFRKAHSVAVRRC